MLDIRTRIALTTAFALLCAPACGGDDGNGNGSGTSGDNAAAKGSSAEGAGKGGSGDGDSLQNLRDLYTEFCEFVGMCAGGTDAQVQACVSEIHAELEDQSEISEECEAAAVAAGSCVLSLSCAELEEWLDETTPDYPCHEEDAAEEAACEV